MFKRSIEKGSYGYLGQRKKRALAYTILFLVLAAAIYICGFLINNESNKNVFTVFAVLMALPMAKFLVRYIVLFPFKERDRESYDRLMKEVKDDGNLYFDLVISSSEKLMKLDLLYISEGKVLGFVGGNKGNAAEIKTYLEDGIYKYTDGFKLNIFGEEKKFVRAVKGIQEKEDKDSASFERENMEKEDKEKSSGEFRKDEEDGWKLGDKEDENSKENAGDMGEESDEELREKEKLEAFIFSLIV